MAAPSFWAGEDFYGIQADARDGRFTWKRADAEVNLIGAELVKYEGPWIPGEVIKGRPDLRWPQPGVAISKEQRLALYDKIDAAATADDAMAWAFAAKWWLNDGWNWFNNIARTDAEGASGGLTCTLGEPCKGGTCQEFVIPDSSPNAAEGVYHQPLGYGSVNYCVPAPQKGYVKAWPGIQDPRVAPGVVVPGYGTLGRTDLFTRGLWVDTSSWYKYYQSLNFALVTQFLQSDVSTLIEIQIVAKILNVYWDNVPQMVDGSYAWSVSPEHDPTGASRAFLEFVKGVPWNG